jgi:hypothetical protein
VFQHGFQRVAENATELGDPLSSYLFQNVCSKGKKAIRKKEPEIKNLIGPLSWRR